jgi:hypothetical protein
MRARYVVCVLALIGCGDDGAPSIDVNEGNICQQVAAVACFNLYSCCSQGEIDQFLGVDEPRTEDQCKKDVERLCTRNIARIADSIANNRAGFDGAIMTGCLEALITPDDCAIVGTELPWTEACKESAYSGKVADGGTCYETFECGEQSFCAANRMCKARGAMGAACSSSQPCREELACASMVGQTGLTCQAKLAEGVMCTSTTQCAEGLFCDTSSTTSRTCKPLRQVGETCTSASACESRTCLPGTCSNGTQICFDNDDCGGRCEDDQSQCFDDQDCSFTGTCSITTTNTCTSDLSCPTGETCVFPVRCLLQTCMGDIVCGEAHVVVDYCEAVGTIPGVSGSGSGSNP